MKSNSLNRITVYLLLSFVLGTFLILTLVKESQKPDDPRETVEFFGKLLEKGDKHALEDWVTTEPLLYRRQQFDRLAKLREKMPISEPAASDDPDVLKQSNELRPPEEIPRHTVNTAKLLKKIGRDGLFDDFLIKEVREVTQKDDQAIVDVLLAKRTDKTGGGYPTKFWLHKEKDGQWRIFLITNFEFNRQWANSP